MCYSQNQKKTKILQYGNLRIYNRRSFHRHRHATGQISDQSRSYIQKLLDDNFITVNGKSAKSNYKLRAGDTITVEIPEAEELDIEPENIPLDIVYEDDDIIVINKPKGMVVHPAPGHTSGTLVNALMYHCKDSLSSINGVLRP